jgi:hypothetical protein
MCMSCVSCVYFAWYWYLVMTTKKYKHNCDSKSKVGEQTNCGLLCVFSAENKSVARARHKRGRFDEHGTRFFMGPCPAHKAPLPSPAQTHQLKISPGFRHELRVGPGHHVNETR